MGTDGNYQTYNVLSVIRMERRRRLQMARRSYEKANPDALALARATADAEGKPNSIAGQGKPRIRRQTELNGPREAVGYDGEPPK